MLVARRSRFVRFTLLGFLLFAPAARGFDFWVTRYDDPAPNGCLPTDCSLREAVIAAGALLGADRIRLSAGTYELTLAGADENASLTGDLDVSDQNLEILGVAANLTIVDANGIDRIFDLDDKFGGVQTVRLAGLGLVGGSADGSAGAIRALNLALEMEECEVTDNEVTTFTEIGAVQGASGATLEIRNTTIAGNDAVGLGLFDATATVVNSTFNLNANTEVLIGDVSTLDCTHCTIYGNEDDVEVEGAEGSTLELTNSVVRGECAGTGVVSVAGNVESPGDTCGLGGGELDSVGDLDLTGLGLNGGSTRTRLPIPNSPLISAGDDTLCEGTDQRHAARSGTDCESGATERTTQQPPIPIFIDGFDQGDAEAWENF
jgi:hypothetical protein